MAQLFSLGSMKTIALLDVVEVGTLLERLKKEAIPFETRTVTQESGLEVSEVMVDDSHFDRGCDIAEAWNAEQIAEADKRYKQSQATRSRTIFNNTID